MAVVTETFDIPMDIMTKLATGEYREIGGVIRVAMGPNKGQMRSDSASSSIPLKQNTSRSETDLITVVSELLNPSSRDGMLKKDSRKWERIEITTGSVCMDCVY